MKLHRITTVVRRHVYEARRNMDRVVDTIYWPVIDVVVWGFLTVYLSTNSSFGSSLAGMILGGVLLWGSFFAMQRDLAVGFLDELWSRNLLNLFATPLSVWEYLVGVIFVSVCKVFIGLTAASVLAWTLYSFNVFAASFLLLPFFLNLLLFGLAIGIFTTALILRYTTKIQTLAWSFAGILTPIACIYYPLATLPSPLQFVAKLIPPMYSFEGMREALLYNRFLASYFWQGLFLNIFYIVAALIFFKFVFIVVRKRGLLVKLE